MTTANPIHWNPEMMTVRQLKDCAETLHTIFETMKRGDGDDLSANIVGQLANARESMLRKYGEAK